MLTKQKRDKLVLSYHRDVLKALNALGYTRGMFHASYWTNQKSEESEYCGFVLVGLFGVAVYAKDTGVFCTPFMWPKQSSKTCFDVMSTGVPDNWKGLHHNTHTPLADTRVSSMLTWLAGTLNPNYKELPTASALLVGILQQNSCALALGRAMFHAKIIDFDDYIGCIAKDIQKLLKGKPSSKKVIQ